MFGRQNWLRPTELKKWVDQERRKSLSASGADLEFCTRSLGLPYMTSAKSSDFLTPSPLVVDRNQLILFLSSAFWDPLYPHPLRTSYMEAPFRVRFLPE